MNCCVTDMRNKEVINAESGCRLGFVGDVEIDTCSGRLVAIIIFGKCRCMGLLGRQEDLRICWQDIKVIGADTILVCVDKESCSYCRQKDKRSFVDSFFKNM